MLKVLFAAFSIIAFQAPAGAQFIDMAGFEALNSKLNSASVIPAVAKPATAALPDVSNIMAAYSGLNKESQCRVFFYSNSYKLLSDMVDNPKVTLSKFEITNAAYKSIKDSCSSEYANAELINRTIKVFYQAVYY